MKNLLLGAAAALAMLSPAVADAATFTFDASFTYGASDSDPGDTYLASGVLTADADADGRYLVTGASGDVTASWGLHQTITDAMPDFFNGGAPSSFMLAGDGSVSAAALFLVFGEDEPGFYGVWVSNAGRFGGFGEVGGPLDRLTITPQATAGVPEPATWAMMIAGFGLVGGALRRRRTGVAFA